MTQNISFDTFVQDALASGDFWVLSAGSVEWQYILSEIGGEFFPEALEKLDDFGVIVPDDRTLRAPVYWARKSMLPVEVLAVRLGVDTTTLRKAKLIRLRPFPPEPTSPTVDYFGRA